MWPKPISRDILFILTLNETEQYLTLKIEALFFSKTLISMHTTISYHKPDDHIMIVAAAELIKLYFM